MPMISRTESRRPLSQDLERSAKQYNASLLEAVDRVFLVSDQPLQTAFIARALNALSRLTRELDEHSLGRAAGAQSDYAVLVHALASPEALEVLASDDPLAEARVRGLEARERILTSEGGALTADQVAKHLRLTRQAVDKRRRAGRLLALDTGRRGYSYPSWQLGVAGVLPGFEEILIDMPVRDPWMQAAFFLSGDPRLGGATPLHELRRGNLEAVRRAARGYGEHGAA